MNEPEVAECGCIGDDECGICFKVLCKGTRDKTICDDCLQRTTEKDNKQRIIHPIKRTPVLMCGCGKIWNAQSYL